MDNYINARTWSHQYSLLTSVHASVEWILWQKMKVSQFLITPAVFFFISFHFFILRLIPPRSIEAHCYDQRSARHCLLLLRDTHTILVIKDSITLNAVCTNISLSTRQLQRTTTAWKCWWSLVSVIDHQWHWSSYKHHKQMFLYQPLILEE